MNNPDPGYKQAVRRLSFFIVHYAERDFAEIREEFVDNTDLMMSYLEQHPELQSDWESLEDVANTILNTYDVEYVELMSDVWESMLMQDPNMPNFWN